MRNGTGTIQDMLDCLSHIGVASDQYAEWLKEQGRQKDQQEKKPKKPYMDILGAIKAVNTFTPAAKAIKTFALTEAQCDDLFAHLEGCERLLLGHWPMLTREEAKSLYGEDYAMWRQDTLHRIKRCKGKVNRPTPETLPELTHIHMKPPSKMKMKIPGVDRDKACGNMVDAVMKRLMDVDGRVPRLQPGARESQQRDSPSH